MRLKPGLMNSDINEHPDLANNRQQPDTNSDPVIPAISKDIDQTSLGKEFGHIFQQELPYNEQPELGYKELPDIN